MPYRYDFDNEARLTNEQLAKELASVTVLTAAEIRRMLPRRVDMERLARLIEIVNGSASNQRKLAELRKNLGDLGPVLLKVLRAVI